jgi:hypothetical protein
VLSDLLEHVGIEVEPVVTEYMEKHRPLLLLPVPRLLAQFECVLQQLGGMLAAELGQQAARVHT